MKAILALALVALVALGGAAQGAEVGQHVELKATHPTGVPIHREARSSMFGRVPDGTTAEVLEVAGHWLRIRVPGGAEGWITETYVARAFTPPPPCTATAAPSGPTIDSQWGAIAAHGPGAVLCLEAGEYNGAGQRIVPLPGLSGTRDRPITVRPLGPVRIVGAGSGALFLNGNRDLVIEPVEICDAAPVRGQPLDQTYCHVWSRSQRR